MYGTGRGEEECEQGVNVGDVEVKGVTMQSPKIQETRRMKPGCQPNKIVNNRKEKL